MPDQMLSDRLCALINPFLSADEATALDAVPEPLKSFLASHAVPEQHMIRFAKVVRARSEEIDALSAALDDATSRERLLEFFAAKTLGPTRYTMTARARWVEHLTAHDAITITPGTDGLDTHVLTFEGCDLRYLAPFGNAVCPFLERQYFLDRDGIRVRPERGDVTMDFGAGAGDTALAFAAAVGPDGLVLACEPTPSELIKQAQNLSENPVLATRIVTVPAAVADRAGVTVSLAGETVGSHIAATETPDGETAVTSTIDALADEYDLKRLDFIKLDIEGMELAALQGAGASLVRFKPKIAVCVYHGWQIFDVIPWLRATLPDYSLHLENHTPIAGETVLYASPPA